MTISQLIILLSLWSLSVLVSFEKANAQNAYSCPDNSTHPLNNSETYVDKLIKSDEYQSRRSELNISSLKYQPIELLTGSSYSCFKLNDFVTQNSTNEENVEHTYYKVGSYFFVVSWYTVKSTGYVGLLVFDNHYSLYSGMLF